MLESEIREPLPMDIAHPIGKSNQRTRAHRDYRRETGLKLSGWRQLSCPACCLTSECYFGVVVVWLVFVRCLRAMTETCELERLRVSLDEHAHGASGLVCRYPAVLGNRV